LAEGEVPEYKYKAFRDDGTRVKGAAVADNLAGLLDKLSLRGEYLIDFKEKLTIGAQKRQGGFPLFKHVSKKKLAQSLFELQLFVDSGIIITQALESVADSTPSKPLRKIFTAMQDSIESGSTLADAMSEHPKAFDGIMVESVRLGELSGNLSAVLAGQGKRLLGEAEMASKIRGQSIYPGLMIVIVMALFFFTNTMVIPKLLDSYQDFLPKGNLPPKTKTIISINTWLANYGMLVFYGVVGAAIAWTAAEKVPRLKYLKDGLRLRIPVLRHSILYINMSRLSEGLSIGLSSGMQVTTILKFLEKNTKNLVLRSKIRAITSDIQTGSTFAVSVARSALHPTFTSMVIAGETTGNLQTVMDRLAEYYRARFDDTLKAVFATASVLVLFFLAMVVAFVMASIVIPMYELPTVLI
jgi:type II secretory pathway component PulF